MLAKSSDMIKLITIIFLCLSLKIGFSQIQDANLWTGIGVESKLLKNWSAAFEAQSRFNKNISALKTTYLEISTDYNVVKSLDIGLGYRFSRRETYPNYTLDNRLFLVLKYKIDFLEKENLTLKVRYKYQYDFDRLTAINEYIQPEMSATNRVKIELEYDFKKIKPFIENEWFYSKYDNSWGFQTLRISPGFSYKFNKRINFSFKYIHERNYNKILEIDHIYSVTVNYKLKGKLLK